MMMMMMMMMIMAVTGDIMVRDDDDDDDDDDNDDEMKHKNDSCCFYNYVFADEARDVAFFSVVWHPGKEVFVTMRPSDVTMRRRSKGRERRRRIKI